MYPKMVQYRMSVYPGINRPIDVCSSDVGLAKRLVKETGSVFNLVRTRGNFYELSLFPDLVRPDLDMLAIELRTDQQLKVADCKPLSDSELLAAVLARGDVRGFWGDSYWGGDDKENVFHLLMCGIDWSHYCGVHDSCWQSFAGTFAERPDEKTMIATMLKCVCGNVSYAEFGLEPPSTASLLAALSMGSLERLFGV